MNDANAIICRISMSPITEEMLGEWQIIGKFNDGSIFQERRQIFHVIQEGKYYLQNITPVIMLCQIGCY